VLLASAAIFLGDRLRFARLDLRDTPRLAAATRPTSFGLDFTSLLDDRSVAPFDVNPWRCDFHARNLNGLAPLRRSCRLPQANAKVAGSFAAVIFGGYEIAHLVAFVL